MSGSLDAKEERCCQLLKRKKDGFLGELCTCSGDAIPLGKGDFLPLAQKHSSARKVLNEGLGTLSMCKGPLLGQKALFCSAKGRVHPGYDWHSPWPIREAARIRQHPHESGMFDVARLARGSSRHARLAFGLSNGRGAVLRI